MAHPERLLLARLAAVSQALFEIDQKELSRSIEISEEEILDDLLYPRTSDSLQR